MDGSYLNTAQIKGFSGLLFNLATGLILGGAGFVVAGPFEGKILITFFTTFLATALILAALELLKEVGE